MQFKNLQVHKVNFSSNYLINRKITETLCFKENEALLCSKTVPHWGIQMSEYIQSHCSEWI